MKYKKDNDISYTLGITVTIELLKNKINYVNKVNLNSSFEKKEVNYSIFSICKKNNIQIEENDKIFNILSDKENCYVIGEFNKYNAKLGDLNHVVLVNPSNMGNLGTILRSALGFGIKDIAIIKPGVDIFDPKVIRASMGAIFSVNFEYFDTFSDYKEKYKNRQLYPFMLQANKSIHDVEFEDKWSLIFGNEASGLPTEYLNIGIPLIIPHTNYIDSLNLQVAVSIAMYEATKNNFRN
jgi:TrmH family RNA methyltransferase